MKKDYIWGLEGSLVNEFAKSDKSFEMMHKAGIQMLRIWLDFPFETPDMETVSDKYLESLECIDRCIENGFQVMVVARGAGGTMAADDGTVRYVRSYPDWMGPLEEDYYFECLEKGWEIVAGQLKDKVKYWQITNEMDHPRPRGPLTHEQNVRWMQTVARAVKRQIPDAKCGTSLSGESEERPWASVHTYARKMLQDAYAPEGLFDFVGLDAYYGSWSAGGPENWIQYINDAYEVTGKPVMVEEWGYSTLQRGKPRTEEDKNRYFTCSVCREKDWAAEPDGHMWLDKEHSEELQAEYIMECEKIFFEHPHCMGNLYFQWQDQERCWQCGEPDCPSECGWGCIRTDGTPKPGYYALVKAYEKYGKEK